MSAQNEYEIERRNNLDYVVVKCPNGHLSQDIKVGEMKLGMGLIRTNPKCNAAWSPLIPSIVDLEAVP